MAEIVFLSHGTFTMDNLLTVATHFFMPAVCFTFLDTKQLTTENDLDIDLSIKKNQVINLPMLFHYFPSSEESWYKRRVYSGLARFGQFNQKN